MSVHLLLLALQSLHKIASRLGINIDVPDFYSLYGSPPMVFEEAVRRAARVLEGLMVEYGVSWWDVYLESDIGAERVLLVEELGLSRRNRILDVGCGRGYFSYAAAKAAGLVVGINIMNGYGRIGWWDEYMKAVKLLGLEGRVLGLAADATAMPFRDSVFDYAVAAHSIRDFSSIEVLEARLGR